MMKGQLGSEYFTWVEVIDESKDQSHELALFRFWCYKTTTPKRNIQPQSERRNPMERRQERDRRRTPTPMLSRYTFWGGKRWEARRKEDRQGGYYVDRYGSGTLVLFSVVIGLNAIDGFLAFYMLHALDRIDNLPLKMIREMGGETFVLAAFIIGSLCALFLFLHKNFLIARLAIGAVILFQIVTISTQLILVLLFHAT